MADIKRLLCNELRRQLQAKGKVRSRIPAGGDLLWRWFLDLSASRTRDMAGPNSITFAEISAYRLLTGWEIEPRHVEVIRALDRVYLDVIAEQRNRDAAAGALRPGHLVTPQSFDAMFGGR